MKWNWRDEGFRTEPRLVRAPAGLRLYRAWGGTAQKAGASDDPACASRHKSPTRERKLRVSSPHGSGATHASGSLNSEPLPGRSYMWDRLIQATLLTSPCAIHAREYKYSSRALFICRFSRCKRRGFLTTWAGSMCCPVRGVPSSFPTKQARRGPVGFEARVRHREEARGDHAPLRLPQNATGGAAERGAMSREANEMRGGRCRDRTGDLLRVKQTLFR